MKNLDLFAAVLLVIGGLNWGIYGVAQVNVINMIFGTGSTLSYIIYTIVGLCALYQIIFWKQIQKRCTKKK